jgi:hypothetical protein
MVGVGPGVGADACAGVGAGTGAVSRLVLAALASACPNADVGVGPSADPNGVGTAGSGWSDSGLAAGALLTIERGVVARAIGTADVDRVVELPPRIRGVDAELR